MAEIARAEIPTTPALLAALARTHGDRVQVRDAGGELSFAEVERRSAALACGLLASGVGKGDKVGLLMGNGCDWVVSWFAITRIGAVAVLLSTFAKPRELAFMLRHADVKTLLSSGRFLNADFAARLQEALPGLAEQHTAERLRLPTAPYLRQIWISETDAAWSMGDLSGLASAAGAEAFQGEMLAAVEREVSPADPLLIIFTSGTTSDPKAVMHSHGSAVRHAQAMAGYMTYAPGDACLTTQPFFWVGGLCTSLLAANIRGACLLSPKTPSPADMLDAIRRQGATHIALWPAQIAALQNLPDFRAEDLQRLRHTSAQQLGLFRLAPPALTPNSLGMSETFGPHSMEYPENPLPADRAGSFGRAVAGVERKVIDPATGARLPPGVEGEICVRGYSLMMGYYKRERSDVFDADGFLHTGDFGWITEDGYLFFTGRRNEMIKTSGANVAPREVELVLATLEGVMEAVVLGVPDPRLGEVVVAAVAPKAGAQLEPEEIRTQLRRQLADYKVPKRIFVMSADAFPRTDSQKVRKPQLAELLADRLRAEELQPSG